MLPRRQPITSKHCKGSAYQVAQATQDVTYFEDLIEAQQKEAEAMGADALAALADELASVPGTAPPQQQQALQQQQQP